AKPSLRLMHAAKIEVIDEGGVGTLDHVFGEALWVARYGLHGKIEGAKLALRFLDPFRQLACERRRERNWNVQRPVDVSVVVWVFEAECVRRYRCDATLVALVSQPVAI